MAPTPEFIRDLRTHIGTSDLWIPAVRGVVLRRRVGDVDLPEPEVLLVRRSDNGAWTVTSGILDPGEQPGKGAVREVAEETAVLARPVRVAGVFATHLVQYANGDRCRFLDTVLEMEPVEGEPRVNDDESVDVGWFSVAALPEPLAEDQRMVIDWALDAGAPAQLLME
ncbi:NUDIX domain-containing protein [Nesterenkonia sp. HG001]|uniref:NUDIX domain-containing protein n=1 Tax=Nesterenkonia sp. HG001 TaxID=2983207 RepID=UPI002AC6504B|nr:NUDIX domain-containing protein [Nesterenkonia sp. HG001]MDZ5076934.1 NUDIX domain-containing protein [Nesterenkonia sp. HG001]